MDTLKALLVLFVFSLSANSHAGYYCSADAKRDGILYQDAHGHSWEVVNLKFEKNDYLESYLACTQLLEKIPADWNLKTKLTQLYPIEEKAAHFSSSDLLIPLCLTTPSCKLSPIDNFFSPLSVLKSLLKPAAFASVPECTEKKPPALPVFTEEEINQNKLTISDSLSIQSVWNIPDVNLNEKIFETFDQEQPKKIFFSSMIFSQSILARIDRWLLQHPLTEAWVFFAYNLHVLEPDFPMGYMPKSKGLHLFPVFQTPNAEDSFHIKGAAFEGKKHTTLLMSVNVRRFREEKVADRVFHLSGEAAYDSYVNILSQVLDEQCSQIELLKCSNILRFGTQSPRGKLVESWVNDACKNRFHHSLKKDENALFSRANFSPLEDQLIEWISQAKKTIFISSHVFHDSSIIPSLFDAVKRGVNVRVMVGTKIEDDRFQEKISEPFHLKFVTKEEGLTSHAKFMVIDDDLTVWGTGNFTKTSMTNPWELFLATHDHRFIHELKNYISTYY